MALTGSARDVRGIVPLYRRSAGITSNELTKLIRSVCDELDESCEWIGRELIERNKLVEESYAYKNIHFPENAAAYNRSRFRLIYDHCLGKVSQEVGFHGVLRSEERRVGKECRSRWSPYH